MILPLICTSVSEPVSVPTPNGFTQPPSRVMCQTCNNIARSEYRKDNRKCEICFVLCVPCGSSFPYLACQNCGSVLSGNQISECERCHTATTAKCAFCPNCGGRK